MLRQLRQDVWWPGKDSDGVCPSSFIHSVSNFLDCTLYSVRVQSVVRALTTRELYSLHSTCVLTLNTNSAHNTLRNKIGMSVGIAVVGI